MIAVFLATIAVALAAGGWIGVRFADWQQRPDADLARFVASPPHEWGDHD